MPGADGGVTAAAAQRAVGVFPPFAVRAINATVQFAYPPLFFTFLIHYMHLF
jgi:hypothetical protein